jgi:hypothetical protein
VQHPENNKKYPHILKKEELPDTERKIKDTQKHRDITQPQCPTLGGQSKKRIEHKYYRDGNNRAVAEIERVDLKGEGGCKHFKKRRKTRRPYQL